MGNVNDDGNVRREGRGRSMVPPEHPYPPDTPPPGVPFSQRQDNNMPVMMPELGDNMPQSGVYNRPSSDLSTFDVFANRQPSSTFDPGGQGLPTGFKTRVALSPNEVMRYFFAQDSDYTGVQGGV